MTGPTVGRRVLIYEPATGGHHAEYLGHLIRAWPQRRGPGDTLLLGVSAELADRHPDVAGAADATAGVERVPMKAAAPPRGSGVRRLLAAAAAEWQTLTTYARALAADHAVVMYFDRLLMGPLLLGRPLDCPLSGIYFRPAFHYRLDGWRERARGARQQLTLRRTLAHPSVAHVFSLDPHAVAPLRALAGRGTAVSHLPDPVETGSATPAAVSALRQRLNLTDGRRVLLLFGAMSGRKGVYEVLDAMTRLSPNVAGETALLAVGRPVPAEKERIERALAEAAPRTRAQLIAVPDFVPAADIPAYYALADVVLATYQRHVGSSGILMHAAAFGCTTLSSDYGLMGRLVGDHHLGVAVDTRDPAAIAAAVERLHRGEAPAGDLARMHAFAAQHTPDHFTQGIFDVALGA